MNLYKQIFIVAVFLAAGCASNKVTERPLVTGKIPRPAHIWVYDFAATDADVPAESRLAGQPSGHIAPQTPDQIAEGRKLGAQIASELVGEIRAMGMPAERGSTETKPRINDLVIRGYLLSVINGSEEERVAIGFGEGASELKTAVEGFQMTDHGLRKL